ncbi:putative 39S ribosomal protein L52, mitochondrial [Penaeus vannamei]|uniref:Large ribosomal subunit protein mL52 n=1 Tax=Penaeus vannamei TaxID=6689 RepID=A0A423TBB9_PENVA|nr:39S ribosomal protein L52, mitochondrial-like [Penaeus vannamei]ROT73745.1 putative 39S ribosomal protein L52, mitochondrial [Penaeus vannamei]
MAQHMIRNIFSISGRVSSLSARCISTTPIVNGKFQKKFDTSMGAWGPLVDGPDYTFLDGRPTPLRSGQRRRAKQQKEVSEKVLQLMKETNFAIERHQRLLHEEKEKKNQILNEKLKPKGHKLLKN